MGERVRRPRLVASQETWTLVKAGFLAGHAAPVLARHYGVRAGEIYRRSCQERWVRAVEGEAPISRPSRPERPLEPAPEPAAAAVEALPPAVEAGAPPLKPPPPPRPAPAIERGRLAASALEGAAALLGEGRLEEAGAYLKLADMSSRIWERTPAEAPTPDQVQRWEAARAFYAGEFGEGDLPEYGQWRVLVLMGRHAAERRHALAAMRDEERGGAPCDCEICSGLTFAEAEGVVEGPERAEEPAE